MEYFVFPYMLSREAHGYRQAWGYEIFEAGRTVETVYGYHTRKEADKAASLSLRHWDSPEVESHDS